MWRFLLLPIVLVLHDYLKSPIDRMYFQKPLRSLVGMRNTLIDMIDWCSEYSVKDYPGLWLVKQKVRLSSLNDFSRRSLARFQRQAEAAFSRPPTMSSMPAQRRCWWPPPLKRFLSRPDLNDNLWRIEDVRRLSLKDPNSSQTS